MDLNENPGDLSKGFSKNVLADVTPQFVAQYPETLNFIEVHVKHFGAEITNICLTNGSAEALLELVNWFRRL